MPQIEVFIPSSSPQSHPHSQPFIKYKRPHAQTAPTTHESSSSSSATAAVAGDDEVWKARIRQTIQENLQPILLDTKLAYEQELKQIPPSSSVRRQRITAKYEAAVKGLWALAAEQYREEVEKERRERAWVREVTSATALTATKPITIGGKGDGDNGERKTSDWDAVFQEQQAILNAIRKQEEIARRRRVDADAWADSPDAGPSRSAPVADVPLKVWHKALHAETPGPSCSPSSSNTTSSSSSASSTDDEEREERSRLKREIFEKQQEEFRKREQEVRRRVEERKRQDRLNWEESTGSAMVANSRDNAHHRRPSVRDFTPGDDSDAPSPLSSTEGLEPLDGESHSHSSHQQSHSTHTHTHSHSRSRSYSHPASGSGSSGLDQDQIITIYSRHERQWTKIAAYHTLTWADFPWPVLGHESLPPPTCPREIRFRAVGDYMLSPYYPNSDPSKSRRERIKDQIRRWHPDRFEVKYLSKVREGKEREMVREGAGLLVRHLSELLSRIE